MTRSARRAALAYAFILPYFLHREFGWLGRDNNNHVRGRVANTALKQERSDENARRDRLYCMVPTIWTPRYFASYHAIKSTWGKRCDILRFTVDAVVGDEKVGYYNLTVPSEASAARKAGMYPPDDVAVLHDMKFAWHVNCFITKGLLGKIKKPKPPPCGNTWEKTYRSFIWVGKNEGDVAEWYAKVDTDTFLFPENSLRFVETKGWSPDKPRNFGHTLTNAKQNANPKLFNAGAAYFFSRAAMPYLAGMFGTFDIDDSDREQTECFAREGRAEDITTARCIYWWWILGGGEFPEMLPEGTLDHEGNELISLRPINEVLYKGRDDYSLEWYWNGKEERHPETGKEMHVCCGVHPIAFHGYKDSRWLYKLEHELYGGTDSLENTHSDDWRGLSWNNSDVGGYFKKVKEALKEDVI